MVPRHPPNQPASKRNIERPAISDFDPYGMEIRADPFGLYPRLIAQSPGFMMAEGPPSAFVAAYVDLTAVT